MRRLSIALMMLTIIISSCKKSSAPGPSITVLSTDRGGIGFPVTIVGQHFGNSISNVSVKFNQTSATPTLVNDSIIVVLVPAGATSGPLSVFINGNPVSGNYFFYVLPGSWTRKADLPFATGRVLGAGFSINAKGYYFGGTDNGAKYNDIYEYNPQTNIWTQKTSWPGPGIQELVSFTINEKAYLGIGKTDTGNINQFWEYDPALDLWTRKADFPGTPRYGVFSFSIGGFGYVGDLDGTTDFWMYDQGLDKWTQKPDALPGVNSQWATSFVIGNKAYCGTGHAGKQFWEYDPSVNSWIRRPDFPGNNGQGVTNAAGFTVNSIGYLAAGSECWAYDPVADAWSQTAFFGTRNAGVGFTAANLGYYVTGDLGAGGIQSWQFSP